MASARTLVWSASRSRLRTKKGAIVELYQRPPTQSVVLCIDELGPEAGKRNPGKQLVYANGAQDQPVQRAKLEVDYEHHGKGYVFGAFRPATGEVITRSYTRRTLVNWIAFLSEVEGWVAPEVERIYVIMDNLAMHKGTDTLLFSLAHPRWEFVYQPKRAAYLNFIEPWWKNLRSLAFAGHSFEGWEQLQKAVEKATEYWNAHRHPFVWGRRRRHQPRRSSGIALVAAHP